MDLVDEDLIYLVHHRIHRLRAEFFRQGREALHVAEHHRDLALLPFDLVPLGEDLFDDAGREVLLDLGDLFVEGELFGNGRGWLGQVVAAVTTKFASWLVNCITRWAGDGNLLPAFIAEIQAIGILKPALGALHGIVSSVSKSELRICQLVEIGLNPDKLCYGHGGNFSYKCGSACPVMREEEGRAAFPYPDSK
jgi:hypothetical protein